MKRSANLFRSPAAGCSVRRNSFVNSRDRSVRLGLMVLREFIRTIYHEVEIHESGAFANPLPALSGKSIRRVSICRSTASRMLIQPCPHVIGFYVFRAQAGSRAILRRQTGYQAAGLLAGSFLPQIEHLRAGGAGADCHGSRSARSFSSSVGFIAPSNPLLRPAPRRADEISSSMAAGSETVRATSRRRAIEYRLRNRQINVFTAASLIPSVVAASW
jgi:hypothetical protein